MSTLEMKMPAARAGVGDILVLLGGATPSAPMTWLRFGQDGEEAQRGSTSEDAPLPSRTQVSRTILVIPGSEAQLKKLKIAARTEAQARGAAPYMFEGTLATEGDLHYAVGVAQDDAGSRLVAAIASDRLREWIERCSVLATAPDAIFLDCAIWPAPEGVVQIIETAQLTIAAAGAEGGFTIESALAPALSASWLRQISSPIRSVDLAVSDPDAWARALGAEAPPLRIGSIADPSEAIARAALDAPLHAPDLMQGAFAVAAQTGPPWRIWRLTASLALFAALLQFGSLLTTGWRDATAARYMLALTERDFRAVRPDAGRIVNLRAQVRALVKETDQASDHPVLALTDPLIRVLRAHPLVQLEELSHAAPGKTVRVRLSAPEPSLLEQAAADLRRQHLEAQSTALPPAEGAGRYRAELVVESP